MAPINGALAPIFLCADEDSQARKAALARYKEKKSARVNNPSKKVRYEMRRINAEKRPVSGRSRSQLDCWVTLRV